MATGVSLLIVGVLALAFGILAAFTLFGVVALVVGGACAALGSAKLLMRVGLPRDASRPPSR